MKKLITILLLFCSVVAWGQTIEELKRKAEAGDAGAIFELGVKYCAGDGVKRDWNESAWWFRKSAEQGNKLAQYFLGWYYELGTGVSQDYKKAFEWYTKAANQGYDGAQTQLGDLYYNGRGVAKDYYKAVEWYRKAAEQGNKYGYYNLGLCYQYGNGVTKNLYKAKEYYEKAIGGGYSDYCKDRLAEVQKEIDEANAQRRSTASASSGSSSRTASSSSSHSSSSSSSGNSSKKLLASGIYTISSQGRSKSTGQYTGFGGGDFVVDVKFYEDYIVVCGNKCKYVGSNNGWKKYEGNTILGSTEYYYVDSNYNMRQETTSISPYGSDVFSYTVVKGQVDIPKYENGGGYSNGGSNSGSYSGSSSSGASSSSKTYTRSCHFCHGTGKCWTCNGTHSYVNPLTNKYVTCPNCKPDGVCSHCHGSGKD